MEQLSIFKTVSYLHNKAINKMVNKCILKEFNKHLLRKEVYYKWEKRNIYLFLSERLKIEQLSYLTIEKRWFTKK